MRRERPVRLVHKDPLVHEDQRVQMAHRDQQDRKVQQAQQAHKVQLGQEVQLVLQGQREPLVLQGQRELGSHWCYGSERPCRCNRRTGSGRNAGSAWVTGNSGGGGKSGRGGTGGSARIWIERGTGERAGDAGVAGEPRELCDFGRPRLRSVRHGLRGYRLDAAEPAPVGVSRRRHRAVNADVLGALRMGRQSWRTNWMVTLMTRIGQNFGSLPTSRRCAGGAEVGSLARTARLRSVRPRRSFVSMLCQIAR